MSAAPESSPPGNWKRFYALLVVTLVTLIVLFYLFTKHFE
jgi:hypothetical protein